MPRIVLTHWPEKAHPLFSKVREHLCACFGEDQVFTSPLSDSFETDALLLLISPCPGSPLSELFSAFEMENNPVRSVIESALERQGHVFAVLLEDAVLPGLDKLPEAIVQVLRRPAMRVTEVGLSHDLAQLVHGIETSLVLGNIVHQTSFKGTSIHKRELPEEDLLGMTDENRPQDVFGLQHSNLSETRRAIDFQETNLNLARRQKDKKAEYIALGKLGLAYGKMGETRQAISMFEKQLGLIADFGNDQDRGALLANLGDAYAVCSEWTRALPYYNQQLALALEIDDREMEGAAGVGLGHCYVKLGDYNRAIRHYLRAFEQSLKTGEVQDQARLAVGLGLNYMKLDRVDEAIEYFKKALERVRQIGDRTEEAFLLGDLGKAYLAQDETDLAIEHYERRVELLCETSNSAEQGRALMELAEACWNQGKQDAALNKARLALEVVRHVDSVQARRIQDQLNSWKAD